MCMSSLCYLGTMTGEHKMEYPPKIIDSDLLTFLKHTDPIYHQI